MGLPVYVVNFDELVRQLAGQIAVDGVDIQIDTSNVEAILNKYFPEILKLLKEINAGTETVQGTQKIKGFASSGEAKTFIPEANILLTGATFSQSMFDGSCLDTWSLKISGKGQTITLLEGIYVKDALQHKYFERYYPVPAGYEIIIEPVNRSGGNKTYWFDVEYLEID